MKQHRVNTHSQVEFLDITSWVKKEVRDSGVKEGLCVVYVPHTTAAVTINECADPSVVDDIISQTGTIIPHSGKYHHMEGNSAAHIKASLFGTSQTIIISGGALALGTWQGIFFCEFDGPRSRNVYLKIMKSGE